ncbi:hypothetical protein BZG36_02069 [Bifiguratus adelaidae]|uniref:Uncharacterized protein n=1 Tax=Bifiguratus adelaidae TaxID=1938954 RepID=A0A261Y391_9FUNG|nr:hypothetical protein BZG36_02069 [Bifiguratus adelaidae]
MKCLLLLSALLAIISLVHGAVSRTGKVDGNNIYDHAIIPRDGTYVFYNQHTHQYLAFESSHNNLVRLASSATKWTLRRHANTKYFTLRLNNNVNHPKCLSTRWTTSGSNGGYDDAAVMWQCETDNKKRSIAPHMAKRGKYPPIRSDKQMWLVVPVTGRGIHNTFRIHSAAHLFDMTPTCVFSQGVNGGLKLSNCKYNTKNSGMYWHAQRVGK